MNGREARMEKEKGYLEDPLRGRFESVVRRAVEKGDGRTLVWLERTFFYPASGGQPDDRGTLGGLTVTSVEEEDGVRHEVAGRLAEGDRVEGEVDMARRLDHMRQHTGQHLLSRVLLDGWSLRTVGFHLGERTSTIDLDGEGGEKVLERAERVVNERIMADIPVTARTLTREQYESEARAPGRGTRSRLPEGTGEVRVVEIEGTDSSTCCGTHCPRTGMIGVLKILGTETVRGGTRVEFVCGTRALEDYAGKHSMLDSLARTFSADWSEVGRLVGKLQEESRAARKECSRMAAELAAARAGSMTDSAERVGRFRLVMGVMDGMDAAQARETATKIREEADTVVLLGTPSGPGLVFACTPGLDLDIGAVLREAASVMGAKGGGGKDFAQGGGGDPGRLGDALMRAREMVKEVFGG